MRKIRTKEEIERIKRRNNIILGIILLSVLILGTIGWSFLSGSKNEGISRKIRYGNLEFIKNNEMWVLNVQGQKFYFQNLPQELENVSIVGFYDLQDYANEVLYVSNNNFAFQEIVNNLGRYVLRFQEACLSGQNCTGDFPVKNCTDNLIVFKEEHNPEWDAEVWQEENCVYISGDYFKGADWFVYKLLGVK